MSEQTDPFLCLSHPRPQTLAKVLGVSEAPATAAAAARASPCPRPPPGFGRRRGQSGGALSRERAHAAVFFSHSHNPEAAAQEGRGVGGRIWTRRQQRAPFDCRIAASAGRRGAGCDAALRFWSRYSGSSTEGRRLGWSAAVIFVPGLSEAHRKGWRGSENWRLRDIFKPPPPGRGRGLEAKLEGDRGMVSGRGEGASPACRWWGAGEAPRFLAALCSRGVEGVERHTEVESGGRPEPLTWNRTWYFI